MKQVAIHFRFLKPGEGLYLNCPADKVGAQSQLSLETKTVTQASEQNMITGECVREGFLCSGWWNKLTGQLWFIDEPIVLFQKVKGGPIYIKELKGYVQGGHSINFQNLIIKNSNVRGFMSAIEGKFTQLWSDNSEQTK